MSRRAAPIRSDFVAELGGESRGTRVPTRLLAASVGVLAVVSVVPVSRVVGSRAGSERALPHPAVGIETLGRPSGIEPIVEAVLTSDGDDAYGFAVASDAVTAVAVPGNRGANLREVFWSSRARVVRDTTTCATWAGATSSGVQQGLAVRIKAVKGRPTRAVTVSKNVFAGAYWGFNVHVWNSPSGPIRQIGMFDLGSEFRVPGPATATRPLPWRMCARTRGDQLEFKVWPLADREPIWGDSRYGGALVLPSDAPPQGRSGWFVAHLPPDGRASFTELHDEPVRAVPAPAVGGAAVVAVAAHR